MSQNPNYPHEHSSQQIGNKNHVQAALDGLHHHHHHHHHGHGHGDEKKTHSCIDDVAPLLENLAFKENEVILDYGCGSGRTAVEQFYPIAKKHGSKVLAIDNVAESVRIAKEKFPDFVDIFYTGDILEDADWPIKEKLDKVIAVHSIQYILNIKDFFVKMHKQLKAGGQIAAALPFAPMIDIAEIIGRFPKYGKQLQDCLPLATRWASSIDNAEWLRGLILESGYSINFWEIFPIAAHNVNDCEMIIRIMSPPKFEMSAEDKAEFKKFLVTELRKFLNVTDPSQPANLPRDSLRFVITKI